MFGCIIVELVNSPKEKLEELFSKMNEDAKIETHVFDNEKALIYFHHVEKIRLWQIVMNLEAKQIPVGFGFGEEKEMAKKAAMERLKLVSRMNTH